MDQATHNKIVSFIWGIAEARSPVLARRGTTAYARPTPIEFPIPRFIPDIAAAVRSLGPNGQMVEAWCE